MVELEGKAIEVEREKVEDYEVNFTDGTNGLSDKALTFRVESQMDNCPTGDSRDNT